MEYNIFFTAWVVYGYSHSFAGFLIAEILMGIATSFWLASGSTFVYDTLLSIKQEKTYKRIYGNTMAISYTFWGVGSLIGAYFATYSLRLPYKLTLIPIAVALVIVFTLREPLRHKRKNIQYLSHLKKAVKFTANHPKLRMFMLYRAITYGVGFSIFFLYQPYLKEISIPLIYFGVVYFAMMILPALVARYSYKIESKLGEKLSLVTLTITEGILMFLLVLQFKFVGLIFPILISTVGGFTEPVLSDYMHRHIKSEHRGTVISLSGLMNNLSSSIVMPFIGFLVDFWSLSFTFLVATALVLTNIIVLYFMYRRKSTTHLR